MYIVEIVLSDVHAQLVFTVIVIKVSDGYTTLTRFIVVTVLSDVHVQVVFTVIVKKPQTAITRYVYREHCIIRCSRAGRVHSHRQQGLRWLYRAN